MSALSQYTGFLLSLGNKEINLNTDSFKIMLVGSSYSPDKAHRYLSSVTGEITGTGYTSGGQALSNISYGANSDGTVFSWKADTVTFENLTADNTALIEATVKRVKNGSVA